MILYAWNLKEEKVWDEMESEFLNLAIPFYLKIGFRIMIGK
jgi:hypothetical protein